MNEISAAIKEQESGIEQVSTAVNQMDSATQQNVSLVSTTHLSAASLREEAERLTALVESFRLSDNAGLPESTQVTSGQLPHREELSYG